jgi:hypothetical protein
LREVDWDARDVAHVVLKNSARRGDRLDDFAVAQANAAGACEVCVGEFPTLNDDAASEFENGIGPRIRRARSGTVLLSKDLS